MFSLLGAPAQKTAGPPRVSPDCDLGCVSQSCLVLLSCPWGSLAGKFAGQFPDPLLDPLFPLFPGLPPGRRVSCPGVLTGMLLCWLLRAANLVL